MPRLALAHGADGIIVSNHGGRQLDGARSSISALPAIVDAVGDKTEVFVDGEILFGPGCVQGDSPGARSVFIGRAFLWGLGAGGEAGVTRVLDILRRELDITMALCGERDVRDVGIHNLDLEGGWTLGAGQAAMESPATAKAGGLVIPAPV